MIIVRGVVVVVVVVVLVVIMVLAVVGVLIVVLEVEFRKKVSLHNSLSYSMPFS